MAIRIKTDNLNMSTTDYMKDVVRRFSKTIDEHNTHMRLFADYHVQVESWLKGELLNFFEGEKNDGKLKCYRPEARAGDGKKKVDYLLKLTNPAGRKVWIELKHLLIGRQPSQKPMLGCQPTQEPPQGQEWHFTSYCNTSPPGFYGDIMKLRDITEGDKYILFLATKKPDCENWSVGMHKLKERLKGCVHIESCTDCAPCPSTYFLGLLEIF